MSDDFSSRDPWNSGMDQWFQAMSGGRRWLEELRRQVRVVSESAAHKKDLGPILQALELLETRGAAREEAVAELRGRTARLEERVDLLLTRTEQLVSALELLSRPRGDE